MAYDEYQMQGFGKTQINAPYMNLPGRHMVDSNLKMKGNLVKQVT